MNNYGIVNHTEMNWNKIIYENTPKVLNGDKFDKVQINKLRVCEFEILAYRWKEVKFDTQKLNLIEKLCFTISQLFKIISIYYDYSNLFFIKVKTQAVKKGIINSNDLLKFNILVKDEKEFIHNEMNSLYVLNIINYQYEIRINDFIYFYLKDNIRL